MCPCDWSFLENALKNLPEYCNTAVKSLCSVQIFNIKLNILWRRILTFLKVSQLDSQHSEPRLLPACVLQILNKHRHTLGGYRWDRGSSDPRQRSKWDRGARWGCRAPALPAPPWGWPRRARCHGWPRSTSQPRGQSSLWRDSSSPAGRICVCWSVPKTRTLFIF